MQKFWVDNSNIVRDFLESIILAAKVVLADTTHLMRQYMKILMPDQFKSYAVSCQMIVFKVGEACHAAGCLHGHFGILYATGQHCVLYSITV